MYPYIRLVSTILRARKAPALRVGDPADIPMMVWPWDCDFYPEMNNGRHLTLMDLGRFDYAVRTGLMTEIRKRGWGLVVGGASVRYRRRLRPFQRYTMRTEAVGRDEKWFYFIQTNIARGEACSSALMRTAIAAPSSGTVPTQEVAEAMNQPDWNPPLPAWVAAWAAADAERPWPPLHLSA